MPRAPHQSNETTNKRYQLKDKQPESVAAAVLVRGLSWSEAAAELRAALGEQDATKENDEKQKWEKSHHKYTEFGVSIMAGPGSNELRERRKETKGKQTALRSGRRRGRR